MEPHKKTLSLKKNGEIQMPEINNKEKKILAIAFSKKGVTNKDCLRFYRTPHHIKVVLERLVDLDYLRLLEFGNFIITEKGKESLGIEEDEKLSKFVQNP